MIEQEEDDGSSRMCKYSFGTIWAIIMCSVLALLNTSRLTVMVAAAAAANSDAFVPPCLPNYLHSDYRVSRAGEFMAKLEIGTLRRQVVGFDIALTFLFDDNTLKVRDR